MHLSRPDLMKLLDTITLVPYTENTIVSRMNFLADLETTRQRGWSLNREEYTRGVISVGAPVFSGRGEPVGAICIDVPSARVLNEGVIEQMAAEVVKTAREISNIGSYNQLG
jgi:DNA-binding IclR family transcriptional regulator